MLWLQLGIELQLYCLVNAQLLNNSTNNLYKISLSVRSSVRFFNTNNDIIIDHYYYYLLQA